MYKKPANLDITMCVLYGSSIFRLAELKVSLVYISLYLFYSSMQWRWATDDL